MRHIIIATMLALSALGGCASMQSGGSGSALIARGDVVETSRRITESYAAAWNANDMDRFGALYAGDARHVTLGGEFLRGRSAIVAAHRANRSRYAESVRMVAQFEGARAVTDDTIVSVAILEFVNDPAQPGAVQRVRLTMTLVDRDGAWVIAQAHASAVT